MSRPSEADFAQLMQPVARELLQLEHEPGESLNITSRLGGQHPTSAAPAGEPRAALVVPLTPSRYDRRTITLLFPLVAAALATKRDRECAGSLSVTRGRRT